ncbi:MAG: YibE/F family protein [Bowdeniella nasicola]|nr:YibE/F family protein [Bowdeniella nasicola]
MHHHAAPAALPTAARRRARLVLAAIVLPLLVATLIATWWLWPRGDSLIGSRALFSDESPPGVATVVGEPRTEAGITLADIELETGESAGVRTTMQVPAEVAEHSISVGDQVRVVFFPDQLESGSPYVFYDFIRTAPMLWLAAGYLLVVVLVSRLRGMAAVVGLLASLGVIVFFVIPALMAGSPPVAVALTGSSLMMFFAVYLAHGISIRTTTALLGTFGGLAVTLGVGFWALHAAHVTGTQSESGQFLHTALPGLPLGDLILCGVVIAGLGALNDVTITQASAVWELYGANPAASKHELWRGGMRIGEDHIASTVYTLAFAYVGTALPVLLLAAMIDRPFVHILGAGEIAEEIVRTLVSSIGLVLAIPLTTAIAVALVHLAPTRRDRRAGRRQNQQREGQR